MPRNLLAAFFVSAVLALLLSFVPSVTWKTSKQEIPTFQASHPVELSEQNVVDLFTLVPTHYNIKRVKWENQSVYVDFVVNPSEQVELTLVYRDFYTLTYDAFHFTDNVRQVFFRILEERQDKPAAAKLLVAIEASRPRYISDLSFPDSIKDVRTYVENTFPVRVDPYFSERVIP